MTDLDLILNCYVTEAQRYAPDGYRLRISLLGAFDPRLPPPQVTLSVSDGASVMETEVLEPADLTRERVIETFAVLAGRAMAAKMAAEGRPTSTTKTALQPKKLSRAEQVLASLDCMRDENAAKIIEAAIADAFEAGCQNGSGMSQRWTRQAAHSYATGCPDCYLDSGEWVPCGEHAEAKTC